MLLITYSQLLFQVADIILEVFNLCLQRSDIQYYRVLRACRYCRQAAGGRGGRAVCRWSWNRGICWILVWWEVILGRVDWRGHFLILAGVWNSKGLWMPSEYISLCLSLFPWRDKRRSKIEAWTTKIIHDDDIENFDGILMVFLAVFHVYCYEIPSIPLKFMSR